MTRREAARRTAVEVVASSVAGDWAILRLDQPVEERLALAEHVAVTYGPADDADQYNIGDRAGGAARGVAVCEFHDARAAMVADVEVDGVNSVVPGATLLPMPM